MTLTMNERPGTKASLQLVFSSMGEPPAPDPDVLSLVSGDWEEPEALMARLINRIRAGDIRAFYGLAQAATGNPVGCHRVEEPARILALETLAGARVEQLEAVAVRPAIFEALASPSERLRFAAIAAASDLSRAGKALVAWAIARLSGNLDESPVVRAAAEAFLRTHRASPRAAGR
jgi:hypothetical protein